MQRVYKSLHTLSACTAARLASSRASVPAVVRHVSTPQLAVLFSRAALPALSAAQRSFHTSAGTHQQNPQQGQGRSWVSPDAVPKGEAMKKYARDLTEVAKSGKLDPVIGRHCMCPCSV